MGVVVTGAAMLDERLGPGWENEIDLDTLALDSPCLCVLGQLFAPGKRARRLASRRGITVRGRTGYGVGKEYLGIAFGRDDSEVGFDTGPGTSHYGALTGAWKRLIRRRKAKRA